MGGDVLGGKSFGTVAGAPWGRFTLTLALALILALTLTRP